MVEPRVYVVDDDPSVRDALGMMLRFSGYRPVLFHDAETFLAAFDPGWVGCVVADLRLPGMNGLELQAKLKDLGSRLPFVIITAHGDVPAARAALRAQAVDFIEKPFEDGELREAVNAALQLEERRVASEREQRARSERFASLSVREREVLEFAAAGLHAREIAAKLGISPRTVEVHKQHIMEKLGVRNVAELVRVALGAKIGPADDT